MRRGPERSSSPVRGDEPVPISAPEVVSVGPTSSGGTHIVEGLNILEGFDLAGLGFGTAEGVHLLAETLKNLTVRTTLSAMRYQSEQDASRSFAEHVAIVQRLRADDLAGAEALMAEHLSSWRAKLPVPSATVSNSPPANIKLPRPASASTCGSVTADDGTSTGT